MRYKNAGALAYFDCVPRQWDAIYAHENRIRYAMNRILRKGIFERHQLTFEKCGEIEGSSILDLGCGTGRYSVEFAKRGATSVVGVDFAPSMIAFSRSIAEEMGVLDHCEFVCGDLSTLPLDRTFHIVAALGVFDYIGDPAPVIKRISDLTSRTFIASFPSHGLLWGIQRKIRYNWIKKCPIFHYSKDQLADLISPFFSRLEILPIHSGFFIAAIK